MCPVLCVWDYPQDTDSNRGSDTTATTLASLFYEVVRNPKHIELIRQEVGPHVRPGGEIPHLPLQHLKHLNAIIHETLRLHPPVGVGLQRITPPEGIHIGDVYIPGHTTVSCPQYVMGRSRYPINLHYSSDEVNMAYLGETMYEDAREFRPERWYESSSLFKEEGAYAPFSAGRYNCIGRPLALLNLRTTVAKLLHKFDVSFAADEDGTAFERDKKTHFTTTAGPLYLRFQEREKY